MSAAAIAFAAVLAAGGSAGAYYYFEVYKKPNTGLDASGANTAVLAGANTTTPAVGATGSSATAIPYVMFPNMDNGGSDISNAGNLNQADCNSKCTNTSGCVATVCNQSTPACWLKNAVNPAAFSAVDSNVGAVLSVQSSVTSFEGTAAPGEDHVNGDIASFSVPDEGTCQRLANTVPGAVGSVFAPNEKTCWMKSSLGAASGNGDRNTFAVSK